MYSTANLSFGQIVHADVLHSQIILPMAQHVVGANAVDVEIKRQDDLTDKPQDLKVRGRRGRRVIATAGFFCPALRGRAGPRTASSRTHYSLWAPECSL